MILSFYRYSLQSGLNCVLEVPVFSTGFQKGVDSISDTLVYTLWWDSAPESETSLFILTVLASSCESMSELLSIHWRSRTAFSRLGVDACFHLRHYDISRVVFSWCCRRVDVLCGLVSYLSELGKCLGYHRAPQMFLVPDV